MMLTLSSLMSLICLLYGNAQEVLPKATLTTKTTIIPLGGNVTLTCSVQGYKALKYRWFQRSSTTSDYQPLSGYEAATATVSSGGDYICQGWGTNSSTPRSDPVTVIKTVSSVITLRRQPRFTPLFRGERIVLSCGIQGSVDSQWTYEWETPPGLKRPPGNNVLTITSLTTSHRGDYRCRARRRHSLTTWSRAVRVDVSSNKPRASLQADRTGAAEGDNATLTCSVSRSEGWDRFRFMYSPSPSEFYPLGNNQSNTLNVSKGGVYVCRGERGSQGFRSDSSRAVTVRKTDEDVILMSPVRPVTEGLSVSLSCKLKTGQKPSSVFFYHNDQVIQNDSRVELNISAVSKSHEGFYKCEYHGRVSAQSRMAVLGRNESSFSVVLVVGLVCGFVIILLLLLCWFKQFKDLCFSRSVDSLPSIDDGSATHSTVIQSETPVYTSLCYGDTSVYESLRGPGYTGSDKPTNEYDNTTTQKGTCDDDTEGSSDYINVNPYEAIGVWRDVHH